MCSCEEPCGTRCRSPRTPLPARITGDGGWASVGDRASRWLGPSAVDGGFRPGCLSGSGPAAGSHWGPGNPGNPSLSCLSHPQEPPPAGPRATRQPCHSASTKGPTQSQDMVPQQPPWSYSEGRLSKGTPSNHRSPRNAESSLDGSERGSQRDGEDWTRSGCLGDVTRAGVQAASRRPEAVAARLRPAGDRTLSPTAPGRRIPTSAI